MKTNEKQYHINVTHPREITKWKDLKIDIIIKLTDQELELMKRQQLQVNEQAMLETGWAKTISYTHMIEHIIKEMPGATTSIDWKIEINHEDEADREILKRYLEQLLDFTEQNILKIKKAEDKIKEADKIQKELDKKNNT